MIECTYPSCQELPYLRDSRQMVRASDKAVWTSEGEKRGWKGASNVGNLVGECTVQSVLAVLGDDCRAAVRLTDGC